MTRYPLQKTIFREDFSLEKAFPSEISGQVLGGHSVEKSVNPTFEVTMLCINVLDVIDTLYNILSASCDQLLEIQL